MVSTGQSKRLIYFLFVVAAVLAICLTVSIALVFTIGVKAIRKDTTPALTLDQPCSCGCPATKPQFQNQSVQLNNRIVNGETAVANSWPWQMLLYVVDQNGRLVWSCGATLISDRHVLTAAQCVHGHFPPHIYVFSGQHALDPDLSLTSGHLVKKVFVHEEYNNFGYNDIAILTVENPIRLDAQVKPICLATPSSPVLAEKDELVAIGWGWIFDSSGTMSSPDYLQQVQLFYIPNSHPNCSEIERPSVPVHAGEMCAGKPGHNICGGDNGGPLMRRLKLAQSDDYYWEQVGIVSKTVDCGWETTWPDVYANVAYYHDWIISTLGRAN